MFKIVRNPEFTHAVPVMLPVDGGFEEQTLKCRFRLLSVDDQALHDLTTTEGTEAWLRNICVSFEDVVGEDGKPIPQSDALTSQLLGSLPVRIGLMRTYTAALAKARLGN